LKKEDILLPNKDSIAFEEGIIRTASKQDIDNSPIKELKKQALDFVSNNPFPNKKDESWKYYNFQDIFSNSENIFSQKETFKQEELDKKDLVKLVDKYVFRECSDNLIVTVNGVYREDLSNFNNKDTIISNLTTDSDTLINNENEVLGDKYLRSLNTLFIGNAFFIKAAKGVNVDKALQVLHISNQNSFNQIRSIIELEENSSMEIIVNYVGLEDSHYISNAIIDCYLAKNSRLKFDKIQSDSKSAVTLYNLNAKLERDSDFNFSSFHFGSKSSRDEITVDLNGANANVDLNGLYVVNGKRKAHQKITVNHNAERCTSTQLFKGIISDEARAEFNGMIDVKRKAQLTDAKQLNNNLLLSEKAHVDSRPQLNILADDVKCAHGSTVGQLNEEELFYLQSRGFTKADAFATLTFSFCDEILKKIKLESVENYATNLAFNNISTNSSNVLSKLANNDKFKKSRYAKN
jgi:Fe-S cluster assembly protein SufD